MKEGYESGEIMSLEIMKGLAASAALAFRMFPGPSFSGVERGAFPQDQPSSRPAWPKRSVEYNFAAVSGLVHINDAWRIRAGSDGSSR